MEGVWPQFFQEAEKRPDGEQVMPRMDVPSEMGKAPEGDAGFAATVFEPRPFLAGRDDDWEAMFLEPMGKREDE